MTRSPILVTGVSGLLGPYIVDAASARGKVVTTSLHGGERPCDLTDADAVRRLIDAVQPAIVVHCAALTDLEACQREPELADSLNRVTTANIARALPPAAEFVMISTDQVYPDQPGPHSEGAEAPVNAYGHTKLAGEKEALARDNSVVIRVNLFGRSRTPGRSSLSDFFEHKFSSGESVTLFDDVFFSPLHMMTLSDLSLDVLEANARGVYNLGCREGRSKADFAYLIAGHLGLPTASGRRGESTALPGRAARPRDLRMDVRKVETLLKRPMPTLAEEVQKL